MTNISFTTKDQYLAYAANWKTQYAELSQQIRMHKKGRKSTDPSQRSYSQYQCWRLRKQAAEMLAERKASKVEAQRQYLAHLKTNVDNLAALIASVVPPSS